MKEKDTSNKWKYKSTEKNDPEIIKFEKREKKIAVACDVCIHVFDYILRISYWLSIFKML